MLDRRCIGVVATVVLLALAVPGTAAPKPGMDALAAAGVRIAYVSAASFPMGAPNAHLGTVWQGRVFAWTERMPKNDAEAADLMERIRDAWQGQMKVPCLRFAVLLGHPALADSVEPRQITDVAPQTGWPWYARQAWVWKNGDKLDVADGGDRWFEQVTPIDGDAKRLTSTGPQYQDAFRDGKRPEPPSPIR